MPFQDELDDSLDSFISKLRLALIERPDIRIVDIRRRYAARMCAVVLACGETKGSLEWVEERWDTDQLTRQFEPMLAGMRAREARRLEYQAAVESTMARFYA